MSDAEMCESSVHSFMRYLMSLEVGLSRPGFPSIVRPHSSRILNTPKRQRSCLNEKPMKLSLPGLVEKKNAAVHAQSPSLEQPSSTDGKAEKLLWFEKKKDLWVETTSGDSLRNFLKGNDTGKPVVFDFYAGWCSSCKAAYPALCKVSLHHRSLLKTSNSIQFKF